MPSLALSAREAELVIKSIMKDGARRLGLYVASADRLGIDLDLDLARLTIDRPVRTIFDVGGNFGQSALRFASAFPEGFNLRLGCAQGNVLYALRSTLPRTAPGRVRNIC